MTQIRCVQASLNCGFGFSVTIFGEILPLWQKIWDFLGNFLMVYVAFGQLLYLLWHFYATGQIVIVVNGQRMNNKIAIWSHCSEATISGKIACLLLSKVKWRWEEWSDDSVDSYFRFSNPVPDCWRADKAGLFRLWQKWGVFVLG